MGSVSADRKVKESVISVEMGVFCSLSLSKSGVFWSVSGRVAYTRTDQLAKARFRSRYAHTLFGSVTASLQCYSVLSTIAAKMNLKFWMSRFFYVFLKLEPGLFQLPKVILNC